MSSLLVPYILSPVNATFLGGFHFHFDDPAKCGRTKVLELMSAPGLKQLVIVTVQSAGHILYAILTVAQALIALRADYDNSVYTGTALNINSRIQMVHNATARLTLGIRKHSYLEDFLKQPLWLPIHKQIAF
ncbi:hypothetical protein NDU88_002548 [Pleurodeles waltl]|uniref:Uncharacterized protein n=1 Tax=Pleurodeles waltl TaxID=8319 RepID=A0AAV7NGQ1_PLEWA|nr:hypothetical protein NDU88_002548 [Pleurodeles waltl]